MKDVNNIKVSTKIDFPEYVLRILSELDRRNYQSFLVGGCVRDMIMEKSPTDWDIATSALPKQVKAIFTDDTTVDIGIKHGTVGVISNGGVVEITTFRHDGIYLDNRHPQNVEYVASIEEDLKRRDFTVNAIAYHPDRGFIDPMNGVADIDSNIIRAVGNADKRISEDALRIMRALRFSSTLGFEIDPELAGELHKSRELLNNIAAERISAELIKMLVGENVLSVLLNYSDVLSVIIPEIEAAVGFDQCSKYHCFDIWEHSARSVALSRPDKLLRLTLLMHDLGKPETFFLGEDGQGHFYGHNKTGERIALERLKALRLNKATAEKVAEVIHYHQLPLQSGNMKKWLMRLGEDTLRLILEVKRWDMATHAEQFIAPVIAKIDAAESELNEIIEQQSCFQVKDLAINGNDLIAIGIPKGEKIGEILNYLLELVVDNTLENTKESLIKAAEECM